MKQVIYESFGTPDVLQLIKVPRPPLEDDSVRIRVNAAGINYADTMKRRGAYPMPTPLPARPGSEVAGEIVELGKNVRHLSVGQRVAGLLHAEGGYAEFAALPAQSAIPIPDSITDAQATALLVQGLTAYHLVEISDPSKLRDRWVFVSAAAGGVGSLLVQLLNNAGARVIAGVGDPGKFETVRTLGAEVVVCYRAENWVEKLRDRVGAEGFGAAFDATGSDVALEALQLLGSLGTLVLYGASSGNAPHIHAEQLQKMIFEEQRIQGSAWYLVAQREPQWLPQSLNALFHYANQGSLSVIVHPAFGLDEAVEAHRAIESRQTQGKVILQP